MKKNLFTILTMIFVANIFAQSPWTREKGKAFVQLGFTSLSYNTVNFDGKKLENIGDYNDFTTQIYAEYGLTNKLEILGILPYKFANLKNEVLNLNENISGLSNVTFGAKYKILDKNWKLSSGIQLQANSIKIGNNGLSTGINSTTIMPFITAGSSKNKLYYFANIGYGYMNNDYSDYFKVNLEVGYEVIPKGHLIFVVDSKNVVTKEDAFLNDSAQWFSHLDRQQYQAFGLKANYEFIKDKFGANIAAFGATGIENSPLSPTINIGLYTKL
jgi:hypothetical protein